MRIVQIAAIGEAVPPEKYGGIELVVSNITEGMVDHGHEVFLLASGDSRTRANLKPLVPQSLRKSYEAKDLKKWHSYYHLRAVAETLEFINQIKPDVVYNHLTWQMIMFSKFVPCPMFTTVHGPITAFYERTTYQNFPQENYIAVSEAQKRALPELNWVKTIYNGIDIKNYIYDEKATRDYFVYLGGISPNNGLAEIIQMIKQTGHKLKIAGRIDITDQWYYESQIEPYIDGNQVEYIGEVGHAEKIELLRHAIAFLQYLNWEEPFSLTSIEAMACGVPVIVNPRGSIPEIIKNGVSGFLINSVDDMKKAIEQVNSLDREKTRQEISDNFSSKRMVEEYLSLAYDLYGKGEGIS